jgi:serine/threonine-protein kinase
MKIEPPDEEPAPKAPRPTGTLSVNAIPWARVFVDGRSYGQTPRTNLTLPAGNHTLKLVTGGGEVRTKPIQIAANRETRITIDFSQ